MIFVLRRGDGMYAYNLAVVLDDIAMGITEIIQGARFTGNYGSTNVFVPHVTC